MTLNEYISLVYETRQAQKEYFKTRNKSVLADSKALERRLDEETTRLMFSSNPYPFDK